MICECINIFIVIELSKADFMCWTWPSGHQYMSCCNLSLVWFMVFNATFNNISAISWRSVLLVEETGVSGENLRPVTYHWRTLLHNVVTHNLDIYVSINSPVPVHIRFFSIAIWFQSSLSIVNITDWWCK